MLPFMMPKRIASVTVIKSHADGSTEPMGEEGEPNHGLLSAASDLISAVHMKDEKRVADALQAAFEICDSYEDNEEGEEE